MTDAAARRALSRHAGADALRFSVHGERLNAWCRIPGSPFTESLLLLPNAESSDPPRVSFGPIQGDFDAITCLFVSPARPAHGNRLLMRGEVRGPERSVLAEAEAVLGRGERQPLTFRLPHATEGVTLELTLDFDEYAGGSVFGSVRMRYMAAYRDNDLMRIFNAVGSDKGSEVYWGEGVPHLYALAYEPLLAPLRHEQFNLLEIGLDTASQASGAPTDAPSLRAWRSFLPNAMLYGYDLHDFSFFQQERTQTFQGDQSSRDDLRRFLETHANPGFRLVIDDGSHASSHQQISLATLLEHVVPGGFYVVEDLNWQPFEESPTTLEVLQRFQDDGTFASPFVSDAEARRLESLIADVAILRPNDSEIAVITRG